MAIYGVYTFDSTPGLDVSGEVKFYDDGGNESNMIHTSAFGNLFQTMDASVFIYTYHPNCMHPLLTAHWKSQYGKSTPYTGTTNGSGVYAVTYGSAYASRPNVMVSFITSNPRDVAFVTASTTTGFSVTVQRRADVIGLLPSYSNQSGVTVDVLVTEQ